MPHVAPIVFPDTKPVLRERIKEVGVELPAKQTDTPKDTSNVVTCMQKLFAENDNPGTRHARILRMASAWRRAGLPQTAVETLVRTWSPAMPADELKRTVNDVFTKGYAYSCHDAIMTEFCDSKCIYFKGKNYTPAVLTPTDMENHYATYVQTDFGSRSIDFRSLYGNIDSYTINPGELVLVMGDTGLNKTAWIQNICVRQPHLRTLFLSLEVNANLIYRRFIQIAHDLSKEEVSQSWKYIQRSTHSMQ